MSGESVLLPEHELLGAELIESPQSGVVVPASYLDETPLDEALTGAALADLTGAAYVLVSGASAQALAECACAGRRLAVGECAFEAVLEGDGALTSAPLVLRTGDNEYALLDISQRGTTATTWLGFLAQVGQPGRPAFPQTSVEDASPLLVPLLLWGAEAHAVLGDYLAGGDVLPGEGELRNLTLDGHILTLCARLPLAHGEGAYLVLVPPTSVRVLWRSLLSFASVSPVGRIALAEGLSSALPWWDLLSQEGVVRVPRIDLERWGLVRADGGFVGIRGLDDDV